MRCVLGCVSFGLTVSAAVVSIELHPEILFRVQKATAEDAIRKSLAHAFSTGDTVVELVMEAPRTKAETRRENLEAVRGAAKEADIPFHVIADDVWKNAFKAEGIKANSRVAICSQFAGLGHMHPALIAAVAVARFRVLHHMKKTRTSDRGAA